MLRRLFTTLIIGRILLPAWLPPTAIAQGESQALTRYAATVYSAPDRSNSIIGVLIPLAKVILEARNDDASWVLGRSMDGIVRGWLESRYLEVVSGAGLSQLRISSETMFAPSAVPSLGNWKNINLLDYPVIPITTGRAREIFEAGHTQGMDPHTLTKVGDCISDNGYFLSPFGWDQYNLGSYTYLQLVIDQFGLSLANDSQAAFDGLVTTAVLDPLFSNPLACRAGESPLHCEFRLHKPSVAIIMFGAQDLLFTAPADFNRNLRRIVHETIQAGVIPVLSTFPGNLKQWDQSIQYNQMVVQIALDYDIPLINLWRALEALPNHGLNDDGRHLSLPITEAGDLTLPNLQTGYPMRNLVTLQALDTVWRNAMN